MKRFFVTATNTDIGKTYVSSILFNALGKGTCYYKPVQTGCTYKDGKILIPDLDYVKENSNILTDENFICSYSLDHEVSPHLSARILNVKIDSLKIINEFNLLKNKFKNIVVEGAGGIFTPLSPSYFIFNLIKDLEISTILVTNTKVGTINNTLLTFNYLKELNVNVCGIVFNQFTNSYYEIDNINFITNYTKINNFLIIPNNKHSNFKNSELIDFINNI